MMSTLAVTANRNLSSTTPVSVHPESVMQRALRALILSGMTALVIGAFLGLIYANPSILASRLGYQPNLANVALGGAAVIGLVGGLIAGLALRGRTALLRWSVAMFALIVGLIASQMVLTITMQIGLDRALRVIRDDVEAAQIGLGAAMSLIGSLAGWQMGRRSVPASTSASTSSTRSIVAPPAAHPVRGWRRLHGPRQASDSHTSTPRTSRRRSTPQVELTKPQAVVKPKRGLLSRRRKVHLGKQSTNVCPYCLEEVLPRDPRGKVVCDICGTPHHGDCWAITGKCEVPHLQT